MGLLHQTHMKVNCRRTEHLSVKNQSLKIKVNVPYIGIGNIFLNKTQKYTSKILINVTMLKIRTFVYKEVVCVSE